MTQEMARWRDFLDDILSSDDNHYLWLRSLSYLEYIGYRKMVKALGYQEVNQGVFHHLSDEIRHSFLLKDLAEKSFEGRYQFAPFDQPFIGIAEHYFQEVDREVRNWIVESSGEERPFLCYLLVSYLIEKRAMIIYPQYYARLQETPLKLILQKIIKDEREHLSYLEDRLSPLPENGRFLQSGLWNFEEDCFFQFLQQFRESLSKGFH